MRNAILILTLALGACSSTPRGWDLESRSLPKVGVAIRASGGMHTGQMGATLKVPRGVLQDTFSGTGTRSRIEVSKTLRNGRLELGVFVARGETNYEGEDGSRAEGDVDTEDFGVVLRGYMVEGDLRPYVEVRGGVRKQTQGSVVPGFEDVRLSGDGWLVGLGVGMEYTFCNYFGAFIQVDGEYAEVDIGSNFSSNTTEVGISIGGVLRF